MILVQIILDFFFIQFGLTIYPYDEHIIIDYVIDLKTYLIYKPID